MKGKKVSTPAWFRKLKICAAINILCFWALAAAAAVSFEADVNAGAEAENAAKARIEAMTKANRDAFLDVAGRLTTLQNVEKLNQLTDDQLLHFIQEVSVISENQTSTSYNASLKIKINGPLLTQYMQENDMLKIVSAPSRVLIVPTYGDTEFYDRVLWEDGNIWRAAWLDKGLIKSGALDFTVIADTPENRILLPSAEKALSLDLESYGKISHANSVRDVYIVNAVRAGRNNLAVIIRSYPEGAEMRFMVNDPEGNTLDKAIAETVGHIVSGMQDKTVAESGQEGEITAIYNYRRLKEWVRTEKLLKKIPQVEEIRTEAAARGSIRLKIFYAGSYERFLTAAREQGLSLNPDGETYVLTNNNPTAVF